MSAALTWHCSPFTELTTDELYRLLQLRVNVFVVEQRCPYSELDGLDSLPGVLHLWAQRQNDDGAVELLAYARLLPPGSAYPDKVAFGRVIVAANARGLGLGHQLAIKTLAILQQAYPGQICHISAQAHLQSYYQQHGFAVVGEGYLEDDIPHIGMECRL